MSKSSASSEPRNSARSALRVLAVTNAYPSPERPTAGIFLAEQVEGLRRAGVAIEVVLFDRLKEGVRSYFGVGARLAEPIRTFDPDVIHVLYGGVLADRVARTAADRPVVVTYHGSDLQGSALAPLRVQLMAEYGVCCSRRAARHAAVIIFVARHLVRFLPEESRPKARVIPCGIDLERFRPLDRDACRKELGWDNGRFQILFATSNEDPIKRPDLARAAVEALRVRGIDAELRILRGVPYERVPAWLNASDVLLLTSLTEGSPTIVKEALACNRPVVSVSVGDVAIQLEGVEGSFLADATPEALAGALARVAAGPRAIEGRSRARQYDNEETALRLKDLYGEVLRSRQPHSTPPPRLAVSGVDS
ncbi:MAG: glycosyltransferase [Thermoanaerobaculia bacterium]